MTHIALIDYAFSETDLPLSLCIHKSSKTWLPFTKSMQDLSASFGQHATLKRRRGVCVLNTPERKRTKLLQLQSCKTLMDISSEYTYMFHMIYNDWIFNKKSINCQGWKQLLQIDIFCNNLDINNVISYVKLICNILWKLSKTIKIKAIKYVWNRLLQSKEKLF